MRDETKRPFAMRAYRIGDRGAAAHSTFLARGEKTCIACRKGIAHRLPVMTGVPGWQ